MQVILALLLAGVVASVPITLGALILWPLDRAARKRRHPTRFTMLDFLGLVFAFLGNSGFGNLLLLCNTRFFNNFARGNLGGFGFFLGFDALFLDCLFLGNAGALNLLTTRNLGFFYRFLPLDFELTDFPF